MTAILLTPPSGEPLTLSDAKAFLRVEHGDDDALISALIVAARGQIEAQARVALLTQTWRIVLDCWPADGRVRLRNGPLRALSAARTFDAAGNAHMHDTAAFVLDGAAGIVSAPPFALPVPGRGRAGIELDVVLGFGDTAGDVPELLRHAVRTLVAHWYENRAMAAIGQGVALLPGSVSAMIASYRTVSL